MNVVIIEDETAAERNLKAILSAVCPQAKVIASLESVVDSVAWIESNPTPDLIFMDIHLADGDAFKIFMLTEVRSPIIFTTAYDRYALAAFKVNSIDYILKPIKAQDLKLALSKLERLSGKEISEYADRLKGVARQQSASRSFLIHVKDKIIPLLVKDIAFCYTLNERVTAYTSDGRQLPMEGSLDSVFSRLPEEEFFRANRQFIISRSGLKDISVWFGSRLSIAMQVPVPERIIISKARVPEFKRWMTMHKE